MAPDGIKQNIPPKREEEPPLEDIFDFEKEMEKPAEVGPEIGKEAVPEVKKEKLPEIQAEREAVEEEVARRTAIPPVTPAKGAEPVVKSETLIEIENILAEDLIPFYEKMPEDERIEFKKKGEETATKIEKLLEKAKVKVGKIIGLIKKWLKIIPGVNKFFLEHEAKIKTDKILSLKEKQNQK